MCPFIPNISAQFNGNLTPEYAPNHEKKAPMHLATPIIFWLFFACPGGAFSLFDDQYYPHTCLEGVFQHIRQPGQRYVSTPSASYLQAWKSAEREINVLASSPVTAQGARALIHWAREQEWFESSAPLHTKVFDQAVSYVDVLEDLEDLGAHITQLRGHNIHIKSLWVGTRIPVSAAYMKQWNTTYGSVLHILPCAQAKKFPQIFLEKACHGPKALLWMYATPQVKECTRWFLYMKKHGHYARGFSGEPYFYTPKAWRRGQVSSLAMATSILDTLKQIVSYHTQYAQWRASL